MKGSLELGYLAKYNDYPDDEDKILVMRGRGNDELAPSKELLNDYKNDDISWHEYVKRFYKEMERQESKDRIQKIAERVNEGEKIRLICYEKNYPCHRFLLNHLIRLYIDFSKEARE